MAHAQYSEENLIQKPAIKFLKEKLGWRTTHAYDDEWKSGTSIFGRESEQQVVLLNDLQQALEKLNPDVPQEAIQNTIKHLKDRRSYNANAIAENRYRYEQDLLVGHKTQAKNPKTGQLKDYTVKIIDFNNVVNNIYHAVDELWVKSTLTSERRRPDLICFVNGLPLVFFEFKGVDIDVNRAFKGNLTDYKDKIPQLFDFNALTILSNGEEAKYGTFTSPLEFYGQWKRNDEDDPEPAANTNQLKRLLFGILDKTRLLDLVENFITFEGEGDKAIKIIAKNHQYLGVNRVIERLISQDPTHIKERNEGRLGVYWHTQGSGKSFSMLFFTEKVLRKISSNYRFVIITDRIELDDQISKLYSDCDKSSKVNDQAVSGDQLRKKLTHSNDKYIFTTVHKFNQLVTEPYSTADNIIVISDEAHRSQYGDLARNMRAALPHAKYLGFTGTPLMDSPEDQKTKEWFGDYVSIYDFKRAILDGATVPLIYENHGAQLSIANPDELNQRIQKVIDDAKKKGKSEADIERLVRKASDDYNILTSPKRLNIVAQDVVNHYKERWLLGTDKSPCNKGMLVCLDRNTCLKMYELITEKWQLAIELQEKELVEEEIIHCHDPDILDEKRKHLAWMKETKFAVVVSSEQSEIEEVAKFNDHNGKPLDILKHRKLMQERKLDEEFKGSNNPLRFVIVCAMWLTGFDVKSLSTLYIDKPMQNHTLMQAIARANRVAPGKKQGTIIDYNGMLQSLRRALAVFSTGKNSAGKNQQVEADPLHDKPKLLIEFGVYLKNLIKYVESKKAPYEALKSAKDEDRLELLLQCKETLSVTKQVKATFITMFNDLDLRKENLLPCDELSIYQSDLNTLKAIYRRLSKRVEGSDITLELRQIQNYVNHHLEAIDKKGKDAEYDLSAIDFHRLKVEFEKIKHKRTVLMELQERIEKALARLTAVNGDRAKFHEDYQKIITQINEDISDVTIQKVFEDLMKVYEDLSEEETRYVREELDNDLELTLFDKLKKPNLSEKEEKAVKKIAQELLNKIQAFLSQGVNRISEESNKARLLEVLNSEIILTDALSWETFNFEDRKAKADDIFDYVLTHSDLIMNRQMYS